MIALLIVLIPLLFVSIAFTIFMIGFTYSAFVWKDTWLVILSAVFWATLFFGICVTVLNFF
jgi:hypothetical protein